MVPNKLRELRKAKKMSLEKLAQLLETSRQTIHRYENGIITNIPPEKIVKLAQALDTTPAVLMGWSDFDMKNYPSISPINVVKTPELGDIACGKPTFVNEELGGYAVSTSAVAADFCLRASGDSMIGARIFDGDIVFVRSQPSVDNGDIAAVIIGDEATLKRVYYYPEQKKLILSPENPKYAPLVYIGEELQEIRILGKAVAFQSKLC